MKNWPADSRWSPWHDFVKGWFLRRRDARLDIYAYELPQGVSLQAFAESSLATQDEIVDLILGQRHLFEEARRAHANEHPICFDKIMMPNIKAGFPLGLITDL